ncbi:hypothetical protein SAMN02799622_01200 [Methylobacterium sp. UNC378MF]|jgi:hypothetical protein|uniref:hypothetical protein n=1 Tax=Methylobacterium sp. UNC378MF TaxID=1502748 RepID=UPI000888B081|nr:hypothetical protein [Methylobacterium sp. UNC378MF]SDA14782.1 hypothetical protein SAMN02799622_01200 [Methylobacterium sp. UNC378MF]
MRKYLVTFRKLVPDDSGHEHDAVQRQAVVIAGCESSAALAAKAMFCEAAGIIDWRLRADSCEVVELAELVA